MVLLWLPVCVAPAAALLWWVWRAPPRRDPALYVWGTFAFGMLMAWLAGVLENLLARVTGVADQLATLGSSTSLLFLLLFAAPLEEALKVLGAWPAFRSGQSDEAFSGLLYATASAAGFASLEAALILGTARPDASLIARTFIVFAAQPLLASFWGYGLGKVRRTKTPTMKFVALWGVATLVHGLMEHLTSSRSTAAIIAAVPLILGLAAAAWWAADDLLSRFGRSSSVPTKKRHLPSIHPPSLRAMREALHRSHRPVLFHWIPLGALTTTGVMLTAVAAAIWTGRRLGLDFSLIDRADTASGAAAPLLLLASAVLLAFPVAGYLVAKASNSDGVLEPALSAATAIVAVLVLLGVATPVALVLALAFAPIAFALACGGAWIGLSR
jgi:RsiW-degrading membrane proteinase PrsW (M82 family)